MSLSSHIMMWVARLSGLVIAGAFTLLLIGEMGAPNAPGPSGFVEWAGIGLMITACAAMLAAWRWEFAGAMVSLAAIVLIAAMIHGSRTFHRAIFIMAIPGMIHMLHWAGLHRTLKHAG